MNSWTPFKINSPPERFSSRCLGAIAFRRVRPMRWPAPAAMPARPTGTRRRRRRSTGKRGAFSVTTCARRESILRKFLGLSTNGFPFRALSRRRNSGAFLPGSSRRASVSSLSRVPPFTNRYTKTRGSETSRTPIGCWPAISTGRPQSGNYALWDTSPPATGTIRDGSAARSSSSCTTMYWAMSALPPEFRGWGRVRGNRR